MLKKNSIISFVLLVVIAVLGILLCVCPFAVPASTDNYNGFIQAIQKGMELEGGVSAIYQVDSSASGDSISQTIDDNLSKIENMFSVQGYTEVYTVRQGDDKIRVVASGANQTDSSFTNFANPQNLYITLDQLSDTVTSATTYITSVDIQSATPTYDYESQSYLIELSFNQIGRDRIAEMKDDADLTNRTTAYLYLGELSTDNYWAEVSVDDLGNGVRISASSDGAYSDSTSSSSQILEMAYSIVSGSISQDISLIQASAFSAVWGQNTKLYLGIVCLIIVILSLAFMWFRYGSLGLIGNLSNIFYLIIFLFLMQSIPFITLTLAGVIGCIFAFLIAVTANAIIFEKIRQEYAVGKKIHLACKGGQRQALWPILDSHFMIMLACIFIWIFAPASLKSFAYTIFFGAIVSLFSSLALTRWFISLYLPLNSTKAYKMRLYRDPKTREIKDDKVNIENNIENQSIVENAIEDSSEAGDITAKPLNEGGDN